MILPFAKGKKYYVVGLGKSGWSCIESLVQSEATVLVWDDANENQKKALEKGLTLVAPQDVIWDSLTALVLSPGIPHFFPEPHVSAVYARSHQIPVICDVDLFFQSCPEGPVVGVTGTNGKSTTAALISHCLNMAGLSAQAVGNIGVPALDNQEKTSDTKKITVIELSSYQLERVPHLSLDVAVHLNLSPDHLSRHGGFKGYCEAKKHIFGQANLAVVGIDDDHSRVLFESLDSRDFISGKISLSTTDHQAVKSGLFYESGNYIEVLDAVELAKDFVPDEGVFLTANDCPSSLMGRHNAQNIMAAYAVCQHFGVSRVDFKKAIASFPGLSHRQEVLRQDGTLTIVNDSKATNVMSTLTALRTYDNIFWIAGGQGKNESLDPLAEFFPKIRKVYLIGQAMKYFAKELGKHLMVQECGILDTAVRNAYHDAKQEKNAVLLFSPACASFDQFKNFEERGEAFRRLVLSLEQDQFFEIPQRDFR